MMQSIQDFWGTVLCECANYVLKYNQGFICSVWSWLAACNGFEFNRNNVQELWDLRLYDTSERSQTYRISKRSFLWTL